MITTDDLAALAVYGPSALVSGQTIAWVRSTSRFYRLDVLGANVPDGINIILASDGRAWFIT